MLPTVLAAILQQLAEDGVRTTGATAPDETFGRVRARKRSPSTETRELQVITPMATVFRHVHFCPKCNEFWACVCWVCSCDPEDRECEQCRGREASQCVSRRFERNRQFVRRSLKRKPLGRILMAFWRGIIGPYRKSRIER